MKATVLAESSLYFIFCPGYHHYCDVYRHELGRCLTLPFFLTFFIKLRLKYLVYYVLSFLNVFTIILETSSLSIVSLLKKNKGNERENSYQKLKRYPEERHTQTHGNLYKIFWWSQTSFSIRIEKDGITREILKSAIRGLQERNGWRVIYKETIWG